MSWFIEGLKKAISDRTLTNLKDYHIPVLVFMFVIGVGIAVFKPAAMTMAFVAFTGTIVGGITGQAFSPARRDDDAPFHDNGINSGSPNCGK